MVFIVMTGTDNVPLSLRAGIASGDPLITFGIGISVCTLDSQLLISGRAGLVIDGGAPQVTINAGPLSRVFEIANSTDIEFRNLIIQNGNVTGDGGGISLESSGLVLSHCIVQNNNSSNGSFGGGGIFANDSELSILNCIIGQNTSTNSLRGGGLFANATTLGISNSRIRTNSAGNGGGLDLSGGQSTISYSSISNNNATANEGGGINANSGILEIVHSTISGNTAFLNGGGIYNVASLTIQNSTIANNQVTPGGGLNGGGGIHFASPSSSSVINSTISGNNSNNSLGGGILVFPPSFSPSIGNTIIAQNTGIFPDVAGTVMSLGFNLVGNGFGSVGFTMNDQVGGPPDGPIDPLLGPLEDNGGPTFTMALLPGSPAIDAGDDSLVPMGDIFDQRGPGFLRIINDQVDVGAFEFNPNVICYGGDSLVRVRAKASNGKPIIMKVRDIIANYYEVYSVSLGQYVPIKSNAVSGPVNHLFKIDKDAFEKSKPSDDFYITSGHMVVINGTEVKARDIEQATKVKVERQYVYSICTDKRCTIEVNGLEVPTWDYRKLLDYTGERGVNWTENGRYKKVEALV